MLESTTQEQLGKLANILIINEYLPKAVNERKKQLAPARPTSLVDDSLKVIGGLKV